MEAFKSLSNKLLANKENVVHLLLLGSFVALGFRSSEQQKELDSLEAEKAKLRSENAAKSASMWSLRESLFRLSEDSDRPVISASRIRAIFGEEEPRSAAVDVIGVGANEAESVSIA